MTRQMIISSRETSAVMSPSAHPTASSASNACGPRGATKPPLTSTASASQSVEHTAASHSWLARSMRPPTSLTTSSLSRVAERRMVARRSGSGCLSLTDQLHNFRCSVNRYQLLHLCCLCQKQGGATSCCCQKAVLLHLPINSVRQIIPKAARWFNHSRRGQRPPHPWRWRRF